MKEIEFMNLALEEARKCENVETAFNVGAVLVSGGETGEILTKGFSREIPGNTHAEECALMKLGNRVHLAKGATIYSTMEPCGQRLSGKVPCATLIINAGISRVVQGCKEPVTFIEDSKGTQMLREAGVIVQYLSSPDIEKQCLALANNN